MIGWGSGGGLAPLPSSRYDFAHSIRRRGTRKSGARPARPRHCKRLGTRFRGDCSRCHWTATSGKASGPVSSQETSPPSLTNTLEGGGGVLDRDRRGRVRPFFSPVRRRRGSWLRVRHTRLLSRTRSGRARSPSSASPHCRQRPSARSVPPWPYRSVQQLLASRATPLPEMGRRGPAPLIPALLWWALP
jgi:hypothetical protein